MEAGDTRVLIDAGLGVRDTAERLLSAGVDPATLSAVLLSHEHQDHAKGAASLSRKFGVRILGTRGTFQKGGFAEAEIAGWDVLEVGRPRLVGALEVTAVPVPHDAAGPIAFVLQSAGSRLGHATDFGHVDQRLVDAFRECHAVLVESNYDPGMLRSGPYPWSLKERILGPVGHLSNQDVARYVTSGGLGESCRTLVLAHLSQKNNHPELVEMVASGALRRANRTEVRLEITGSEGTDWIPVVVPPPPRVKPTQLRLF